MRSRAGEKLKESIAAALATNVKSYDLPQICVELGLADGNGQEAFASKRSYVLKRMHNYVEAQLIELAQNVLKLFEDANLFDTVSEILTPLNHRITEITRRRVLKALNSLPTLFGDVDLHDGLRSINPPFDDVFNLDRFHSLSEEIDQHYTDNPDWSHSELLENCGALTCSQHRFFALLEKILDPIAREGQDQKRVAEALTEILRHDGYQLSVISYISNSPRYAVQRLNPGVSGTAKNIIFASTGEKPEIVLRDAINNDVQITKNAELCLIYDRPLPLSGLTWNDLASWWQDREREKDLATARKSLGSRLRQAVLSTSSPGEYAVFRTYYEAFPEQLGERLPALIPQVYLHYDPYTAKQHRGKLKLARQRMDFLMLMQNGVRIIIEVDGKHHFADGEKASPAHYAELVAEDRKLRLAGYELYRFGAAEFADTIYRDGKWTVGPRSRSIVRYFFDQLFEKHQINIKRA